MSRNRLASVSPDQLLDCVLLAPPQPHRNAMSTPRRETPTKSLDASMMILDEVGMSESIGSRVSVSEDQTPVQSVALRPLRKCRTATQLEALEALRTLDEPFSTPDIVAALDWSLSEARHWAREFSARGYLVGTAWTGYRWTDAARRVG